MESINDKIKQIYEDKSGFGSLKQTIADVKRYHPEINKADVVKWYNSNVDRNVIKRDGYNST